MFLPLAKRIVKYSFTNKYSTVLSGINFRKCLPWETKHRHIPSACYIQVNSRLAFVRNDSTCPQPDQMASTGLTLGHVVSKLNSFASRSLAESWDNVGLLIEPATPQRITRILLTNDLTDAVMKEALDLSVQMIVSYHPPIFTGLKSVIASKSWKERIVALCLENKIALYSPHTSWDAVEGGVNDWLASAFETECSIPIMPSFAPGWCEMAITIPGTADADAVAMQLRSEVEKSLEIKGDEPFVSNIIQTSEGNQVIQIACSHKALLIYEESFNKCFAASHNYGLKTTKYEQTIIPGHGMGRTILLLNPMPVSQVVNTMKKFLNLPYLRLALAVGKDIGSKVSTIAICAGSGQSVLKNARSADLYLTGEMQHHDVLEATHNNSHVILTNHSDSERGFLVRFADKLANKMLDGKVTVVVSKADCDPLKTV